jgi:DNA-directed RNA polymerase sigma subunit (sigma70/sigma32)
VISLEDVLARLDDREAELMRLRYGHDRTPPAPRSREELATAFKLSTERIGLIEERALSKLNDEERAVLTKGN